MNGIGKECGDDETEAIDWQFDTDQRMPEIAIAEVISRLDGRELIDMTPVHDTIGHLVEALFSEPLSPDSQAVVQFHYEGYRITVDRDGGATFRKLPQDE